MPEATPTSSPPDDLISHEKMIPLIIDLQVLESHYHKRYQRANLYKDALDSASYFVFEAHAVSKDQFKRSYEFYSKDINKLYLLLETTLDTVNNRVNQNQQPPQ